MVIITQQVHFGWAIANLYRNGNDAVKAELQLAYEDAQKRPQTLERHKLIAIDHIMSDNIIQSYEEYLEARRSDFATGLIHFLYKQKRIF